MIKTYIMNMEDRPGAFLEASRIIGRLDGNICRVNYNKAVDMHILFMDVDAHPDSHQEIFHQLTQAGYLTPDRLEQKVMVLEMKMPDEPGELTAVLEVLSRHAININYMNTRADDSGFQLFRMGILVENPALTKILLEAIAQICSVRILDYHVTEKALDGTVFYIAFSQEMRKLLRLNQKDANRFLIDANNIMQFLDKQGEMPQKTFDYLGRFARFVVEHQGAGFNPIVSRRQLSLQVKATLIEPPCGSNTCILDDGKELLFVDGGFSCYLDEMTDVMRREIPGFDEKPKTLLLTHGDIDHTGLWRLCDKILVNGTIHENFVLEHNHRDCFREQEPQHAPYGRIAKIITQYQPPALEKLVSLGQTRERDVLNHIGYFNFGDLCLRIFQGRGGHVRGEMIFLDDVQKIMFTGDNLVNIRGFSKEQKEFNILAPYLMSSVNMDSKEASTCRKFLQDLGQGYFIIPGHGKWLSL